MNKFVTEYSPMSVLYFAHNNSCNKQQEIKIEIQSQSSNKEIKIKKFQKMSITPDSSFATYLRKSPAPKARNRRDIINPKLLGEKHCKSYKS